MSKLKIVDYLINNPDSSYSDIADAIGIDIRNVKRTVSNWDSCSFQIIKKFDGKKYLLSVEMV